MEKPEPKQKRSKETREKIINAAEKLFSELGYKDVNTNMIAVEAGVSVGSFYNYFDDKKHVLMAVLKRYNLHLRQEMSRAIPEDLTDLDVEEVVLGLIKMSIETHKEKAGLMKMVEGLRSEDEDIETNAHESHVEFIDLIKVMLMFLEQERGIKLERIDTKAKVIMTSVEGLCHENIFYDMGIDEDELALELTDLIMRYLSLD